MFFLTLKNFSNTLPVPFLPKKTQFFPYNLKNPKRTRKFTKKDKLNLFGYHTHQSNQIVKRKKLNLRRKLSKRSRKLRRRLMVV